MSGCSSSAPCPICGEEMSTYSDYKPFDTVYGECMYCGFSYYTKVEQMDLERVNELRAEFSEDSKPLKPLTQKKLNKYRKVIKEI